MAHSRTSNLFELLRDASEGSDGKKRKEEKKTDASAKAAAPKAAPKKAEPTQKAVEAPKAAPVKAAPKSADAKQDRPAGERKPRTENNNRGGEVRVPKGEGRPREDRRDKVDRNRTDQVKEDKGFVHPTKRAYERRSGTGRPFSGENKKGGAGKGNWGKPGSEQEALADVNSELAEQTDDATPKTGDETKENEPAAPKQLTPEEEAALKEKEKEERMLTLEEYRKKQEEEKAKIPLPQPRKAGEGSNEKKWANFQKLEKEEESLFSAAPKKKGTTAAAATATSSPGTKKNVVPVTDVLNVKQDRKPERGGRDAAKGGRGGRGGGGGGGQRSVGGGRGKAEEFSLNDQAFPALSEKVKA